MAPEAVQPLRINKSTPTQSPAKMNGSSAPRALQEISPMGIRRNSPSFGQTGKSSSGATDSSPFEASPRTFWQSRESVSPSRIPISENSSVRTTVQSTLQRQSSLENLQKASRVSKSTMFAREHEKDYDPESPVLERPLAGGRPLSVQYSGNAWSPNKVEAPGSQRASTKGHRRNESQTNIPFESPTKQSFSSSRPLSPSKDQAAPQKSSFSGSGYKDHGADGEAVSDEETTDRAATPRQQLRPMKSVTFDAAPPQVNEYEMITPDPSSVASGSREGSYEYDLYDMDDSFERDGSAERDDSFDDSLEDADKTPVVLPEDWRFMSPEAANTGLSKSFDDPFDRQGREHDHEKTEDDLARSASVDSNGNPRPLPPLPSRDLQPSEKENQSPPRPGSSGRSPRSLPTPPRPASTSKAEILGMRDSPMSLSERLRLMALQEEHSAGNRAKDSLDLERERKLEDENQAFLQRDNDPAESGNGEDSQAPPRISRDSILRNMQNQDFEILDEDEPSSVYHGPRHKIDYANLDPDVPIPSRESSSSHFDDGTGVLVKRDEVERVIDRYSISREDIKLESSPTFGDEFARDSSVIRYDVPDLDREETEDFDTGYEDAQTSVVGHETTDEGKTSSELAGKEVEDDQPPPVPAKDTPEADAGIPKKWEQNRMSLPEFTMFGGDDFGFGLRSYMSQSPPDAQALPKSDAVEPAKPTFDLTPTPQAHQREIAPTPSAELEPPQILDTSMLDFSMAEEAVETPNSVIHNPFEEEESLHESQVVPEPVATIKAPGGKLKTRPSATPADLSAMVTARREVSGETTLSIAEGEEVLSTVNDQHLKVGASGTGGRPSEILLDLPLGSKSDELEFGVGEEFDRLLEAQKRGYVMRQNTKIIVASNRQVSNESKESKPQEVSAPSTDAPKEAAATETKAATSSPQKPTDQILKTEPWNGRIRRQSTRRSNIVPDKRLSFGPAPPLPGQESAATGADLTANEDLEAGAERGRLFVKVVGVKDLDLPLPKKERCNFQLTLDNGLHCVTTTWMELGKTAPIGQEFELVVFDDLEFQLTLQTKLERPQSQASSTRSSAKSLKTQQKQSAFSRLLTSPKKRKEMERKQKEEEEQAAIERQREIEAQRANIEPTAWDLQHELVGSDGSFARAYVSLSNHEQDVYGRPATVDIPCYNEWAVEDKAISNSTNSKLGGIQRKPPYKIAKIELQLLYVPKPKGVKEDDMPRSMAAAVKQMKEAETKTPQYFEGHLSQQGGDCPYWRRRFFKLQGSKLTAYHETTRQPRVSISLAKAMKLVDDKSSAKKAEASAAKPNKGRRQSAVIEEDEAYTFLPEEFRIRFANAEVIDFYADTKEQKESWMKVLSEVVGKDNNEKPSWMSMVLAKEKAQKLKRQGGGSQTSNGRGVSKSAPTSPLKGRRMSNAATAPGKTTSHEAKPQPIEKSPRHYGHAGKDESVPAMKTATTPAKPVFSSPQKTASPSKATTSSATTSPLKSKQSTGIPTPRLTKQVGKRQGVRSMIF